MTELSPSEAVFFAALEKTSLAERAAYLDIACAGQPELRARVEKLLAAQPRVGEFLQEKVAPDVTATFFKKESDATADYSKALPGTLIAGRYKLLQQIGEGGMGTVWMADQTEPVKRKVAVKLIRVERGQSKTILARFEAERQAIALMDHPHIAKLLDAGTTETGAPFFIMELVKGVPLTEFCDAHKLGIAERLSLFQQICGAVQHAHQKGIIHRDLKPGNILVESHDGKPVPKVIDFGLAKATTGLQLTEQSMFTAFGSVMGTPLYMAPEQATFNAVDVDTRADVYALGVILYELLTGTTPITRESLKKAALDEMLKLIREQEAPTPSSRLSSADSLPSVSANRQTEPQKLGRFVKGELDWIVLKALSKERDRRYETANGFAKDIERFLNHEPVTAGPVTAAYRVRKFVQRNRGQVLAAGLVLAALVAGVVGTSLGLLEARRQTGIAREQEAEAVTQAALARAEADAKEQARAAEAVQRAAAEAEKKKAIDFRNKALDALRATTGDDVEKLLGAKKELTSNEKAYLEAIAKRWQTFARQEGTDEQSRAISAEGHFRVAYLWMKLGRREEARPEYEQAVALREKLAADFPIVPQYRLDLALSHNSLGLLLKGLGKRTEAEAQYRKAVAIQEKLVTDFPFVSECRSELASSHTNLGVLLAGLGKWPDAEEQFKKGLTLQEKLATDFATIPDYRSDLAKNHNNMGLLLVNVGKQVEAEEQYRKSLALKEKLAADFPAVPIYRLDLAASHNNLGMMLSDLGNWGVAEEHYRKALSLREKLAFDYPAIPQYRRELALSYSNLGLLQVDIGKRAEAEEHFRKGLALREKLTADFPAVPEYRVDLGSSYCIIGNLVRDSGKPADALVLFDKAIIILRVVNEADPQAVTAKLFLRNSHKGRARTNESMGRHTEAVLDWDKSVELSPSQEQSTYRASRAMSRLKAGMLAEAVAEVAELTKSGNWNANQLYNFACIHAVASGKIADKKTEYADRAMELLQKAIKAGYKDVAQMKKDTDLNALREREDFKKLLADLEKAMQKPEAPKPPEKK
jgi:eukaryotic-like serine/threonine-protein kinase